MSVSDGLVIVGHYATYHDNSYCVRSRCPHSLGLGRHSYARQHEHGNDQRNLANMHFCLETLVEITACEEGSDPVHCVRGCCRGVFGRLGSCVGEGGLEEGAATCIGLI